MAIALTVANWTVLRRAIGAAALDAPTYEEVETDPRATAQAATVVVLSSLATGVGFGGLDVTAVTFFSAVALVGWASWALVTYHVGVHLLPEPQTRSDVGELLRTTGFATAPGMLRVFGVLPGMALPVFAATAVWMLVSMVVGVRQALDYSSTRRAVAVCGIGWVLSLVFVAVVGFFFGTRVL